MVIIYENDDEPTRKRKRELNKQLMREEHEKGAIYMLNGIPENCLVMQPGDEEKKMKDIIAAPFQTTVEDKVSEIQRQIKEAKKRVSRQTTW